MREHFKLPLILILILFSLVAASLNGSLGSELLSAPALLKKSICANLLNPSIRVSQFTVSPAEFDAQMGTVEKQLTEIEIENSLPSGLLTQPSSVLMRALENQQRIQRIINYAMSTQPLRSDLLSVTFSIHQKLNPLHVIAEIDDRVVLGLPYLMIKMDPNLIGESVVHVAAEERLKYRLMIQDGKFYNSSGRLFSTSPESPGIYVMDEAGNIYAAPSSKVGVFHHSSFLAGQPVAAAGQIVIKNGELVRLDDRSGHYLPPRILTERFVTWLREQGVRLSDEQVQFIAPLETAERH